jgi:hypothetical protein
MSDAERRERARLRSERFRQAHGIAKMARATAVAGGKYQPVDAAGPTSVGHG